MKRWTWVDNPAYAGKEPTLLEANCHDGSPFATITCDGCASDLHVHESQIAAADQSTIGARCPHCRRVLVFNPGEMESAFAEMRARGWIR